MKTLQSAVAGLLTLIFAAVAPAQTTSSIEPRGNAATVCEWKRDTMVVCTIFRGGIVYDSKMPQYARRRP